MLIHFHNFILIGFFGNPMHSNFLFFAFKNAVLRGVLGHHQLPRVLWQVHTSRSSWLITDSRVSHPSAKL